MFKCILCLNGVLPNKSVIVRLLNQYKSAELIAVDGAANQLLKKGLIPRYVMGDFDSFEYDDRISSENLILLKDQNSTDFEKSLSVIKKRKLYPVLVLGVNGGELDHVIDNIHKFVKYSAEIPMVMYDYVGSKQAKWGAVINKQLDCKLPRGSTVSVFPYHANTHLESDGLKWELNGNTHGIFDFTSTRNVTIKEQSALKADQDKTLLIVESNACPFIFEPL